METERIARREFRRRPWGERMAEINDRWPSTTWGQAQWFEVLGDYDLLGRILRDVLKVGYEEPSRRGQRGPLEWSDGMARLRALNAQRDGRVSLEPFPVAFTTLSTGRSITQVARRVEMSRSQVHRFLSGEISPAPSEMEQIAAAFGKPPTFFAEYRVHLITQALANQLMASPESSVDIVHRLGIEQTA